MYPLVPLAAASYLSKGSKKLHPMYYLLLSLPGLVLAGYHYLLQKTDIFGEFGTCSAALPCGAEQINYLGFVTIPMMALAGFILISLISALAIYNRD
jgi:disulfide bond formation protein DsbB